MVLSGTAVEPKTVVRLPRVLRRSLPEFQVQLLSHSISPPHSKSRKPGIQRKLNGPTRMQFVNLSSTNYTSRVELLHNIEHAQAQEGTYETKVHLLSLDEENEFPRTKQIVYGGSAAAEHHDVDGGFMASGMGLHKSSSAPTLLHSQHMLFTPAEQDSHPHSHHSSRKPKVKLPSIGASPNRTSVTGKGKGMKRSSSDFLSTLRPAPTDPLVRAGRITYGSATIDLDIKNIRDLSYSTAKGRAPAPKTQALTAMMDAQPAATYRTLSRSDRNTLRPVYACPPFSSAQKKQQFVKLLKELDSFVHHIRMPDLTAAQGEHLPSEAIPLGGDFFPREPMSNPFFRMQSVKEIEDNASDQTDSDDDPSP